MALPKVPFAPKVGGPKFASAKGTFGGVIKGKVAPAGPMGHSAPKTTDMKTDRGSFKHKG